MPPRATPTVRQQRVGAELRKLRERAGLSARAAGELLSINPARISSIEGGYFGVSDERVRTFAHSYGCADEAYIDALAGMRAKRGRGWWEEYREVLPSLLLDLAEMESCASALRAMQVSHMPGLLQTIDYARLTFQQNIPAPSPPHIEHLVSHRIKRQEVLHRADPVPFKTVIHEAALRMMFGGAEVTRSQLRHLLAMGEMPQVTVLVIPFSAGIFPGAGQTVVYAEGPVPQLDTIQLDTEHGSVFLDADAELQRYRIFADRFEAAALDEAASRDFITGVIASL